MAGKGKRPEGLETRRQVVPVFPVGERKPLGSWMTVATLRGVVRKSTVQRERGVCRGNSWEGV